jgi:hypothetical protein
MKSFTEFILEATSICNQSGEGKYCPSHGKENCSKLKSYKTAEQIAKKHRLDISFIETQLKMGVPIEYEHTEDKTLATKIALQHLGEIPDYYTRLNKMEASAKKEHKKFKDVKEDYTTIQSRGSTYTVLVNWRGQHLSVQIFFPKSSRPTKDEVVFEIRKIYPNATVFSYSPSVKDPTKPLLFTGI